MTGVRRRWHRLAGAAALALTVSGCAAQVGAPQASIASIEAVRRIDIPSLKLGDFKPGGTLKPADDKSITIRAINVISAPGGSFAGYLKATLEADLRAAGRLDGNSPYVLNGVLIRSDLSSAIGTGTAAIGATFTLLKDGKSLYEKNLSVDATWDSSFLGAIAIPDAINNYTGLYEKLSLTVLSDPDFKAAFAKP